MRNAGLGLKTADYGMGLAPIFFYLTSAVDARVKHDELTELLSPVVTGLGMGLECLGVDYSPSAGNSLVRIYIDASERSVTVEDCEAVSREVSATLDVNDPIDGQYTLEVSSPGMDRPLFTPQQFARFIGSEAKLSVGLPVGGRRRFRGLILAVEGDKITMQQDDAAVQITHANIQKANLVPDFAKPEKPKGKAKKTPGTKADVKKADIKSGGNKKSINE